MKQLIEGVWQGWYVVTSAYAEYIMWNAGLNESQIEIKIAGRNTNKPQVCS